MKRIALATTLVMTLGLSVIGCGSSSGTVDPKANVTGELKPLPAPGMGGGEPTGPVKAKVKVAPGGGQTSQ